MSTFDHLSVSSCKVICLWNKYYANFSIKLTSKNGCTATKGWKVECRMNTWKYLPYKDARMSEREVYRTDGWMFLNKFPTLTCLAFLNRPPLALSVVNTAWNKSKEQRKEGRKEGRKAGRKEGRKERRKEGKKEGRSMYSTLLHYSRSPSSRSPEIWRSRTRRPLWQLAKRSGRTATAGSRCCGSNPPRWTSAAGKRLKALVTVVSTSVRSGDRTALVSPTEMVFNVCADDDNL